MDVAALLVSLLALLVAGWAAWQTRRQAESADVMAQNDSERRAEERAARAAEAEQLRHAAVDLRILPPVRNGTRQLLLSNDGPAVADEVAVSFVRPLSGDGGRDAAFDGIEARRFTLKPGDRKELGLSPDYESATLFEVAVRWIDPDGEHELVCVVSLAS